MKSSRYRMLGLVCLVLLLGACGNPENAGLDGDTARTAMISGVVVDMDSKPAQGLQVVASPVTASLDLSTMQVQGADDLSALDSLAAGYDVTDRDGRFALHGLEPGDYVITVIGATGGASAPVTLGEGGAEADVELRLTASPLGAVSGRVEGIENLEGVLVYLVGANLLTLTDRHGEFLLSGVPSGSYRIAAGKDGHASGDGVEVEVKSGELTHLEAPLVLSSAGPTIEDLSSTLVFEGASLVITGSGFGSTRGLSVIEYAGVAVPPYMIRRWSDHEIELVFGGSPYSWLDAVDYLPHEERTFTVRTIAGEARSTTGVDYAEYVSVRGSDDYVAPGETITIEIEVESFFWTGLGPDQQVAVTTSAGSLDRDTVTLDEEGFAEVILTPESDEPHTVTFSASGTALRSFQAQCCSVESSAEYFPLGAVGIAPANGQEYVVSGKLLTFAGDPVPGEVVKVLLEGSGVEDIELATLVTDDEGYFATAPQAAPEASLYSRYVYFEHAGYTSGHVEIEAGNDPVEVTVEAFGTGSGTVELVGYPTCTDTCTYSIDDDYFVGLVARPDEGSTFIGWSGDEWIAMPACEAELCRVSLDDDEVLIRAEFSLP